MVAAVSGVSGAAPKRRSKECKRCKARRVVKDLGSGSMVSMVSLGVQVDQKNKKSFGKEHVFLVGIYLINTCQGTILNGWFDFQRFGSDIPTGGRTLYSPIYICIYIYIVYIHIYMNLVDFVWNISRQLVHLFAERMVFHFSFSDVD